MPQLLNKRYFYLWNIHKLIDVSNFDSTTSIGKLAEKSMKEVMEQGGTKDEIKRDSMNVLVIL